MAAWVWLLMMTPAILVGITRRKSAEYVSIVAVVAGVHYFVLTTFCLHISTTTTPDGAAS